MQRLLRRAALPVDGNGGNAVGKPGGEHHVAADMKALLADLADTADDHILDRLRVNVRAVDQRVQHLGAKIGRVPVLERTAAATAGGPPGFDDIGFSHWRLPGRTKRRSRAKIVRASGRERVGQYG